MVLLSITPLLDGVLRLDIIAPFHTSGPPLLQFHLAIEQWGKTISGNNVKTKFPIAFTAFCMLSVSVNSSNGNAAESVFRNGFGYTNKTLSDWILRGPTSDATYFADYIAIGC